MSRKTPHGACPSQSSLKETEEHAPRHTASQRSGAAFSPCCQLPAVAHQASSSPDTDQEKALLELLRQKDRLDRSTSPAAAHAPLTSLNLAKHTALIKTWMASDSSIGRARISHLLLEETGLRYPDRLLSTFLHDLARRSACARLETLLADQFLNLLMKLLLHTKRLRRRTQIKRRLSSNSCGRRIGWTAQQQDDGLPSWPATAAAQTLEDPLALVWRPCWQITS